MTAPAFAGPTGGTVVQGNAGISTAGSVTNINQSSDKAIINWQSFSVGKGETVNFNQPTTTSVTLNRVTGNEQSVIAGALNANGRVFLVNSNGILFTQGSQVNVGGLVASTLDISDDNFMAGKYTFGDSNTAVTGAVVNQGHIRASAGGYVALLGKTVSNDGVISATLGTVAMASGNKITLNFDGNSLIDVTIDEGTLNALVQNKGAIKADGGRVILTAKAADSILSAQVNNSGIIQARTMSALKGGGSNSVRIGTIKLTADGGSVSSSGKLIASAKKGGNGGTVSLAATGGSVTVAGDVDVSSIYGTGGTVTVTGQDVVLASTAAINANGLNGGIILVGGDRHGGSDPTENLIAETLANATTTTVAAGATLSANGTNGNGGNIVIWSNDYTNYAGSISATGAGSGNGGFAEVSSEGVLGFTGTANLLSANGTTGTLLLDPYNVVISSGTDTGTASLMGSDPTATSVINIATLIAALANANVTITTGASGSAGSDAGNITIANALSWTTPYTLTLLAANDININAAVSWGTGGSLTATATAGNVNVNAPITWSSGTLSLNAGKNVYVNDVLTATGSGSFVETNGSGQNIGGQSNGFYLAVGSSGYAGRLDISGTGSVTLNGTSYQIIDTAPQLANAENNPNANYVLGANIDNLNYSDLAAFGFGSSSTFTGNFVGLGHSLSISPTAALTIASAITIPANITLTNFNINSIGDLDVNVPVSWSSNLLSLSATNNVYVNAVMSATNNASFAATYGTGTNTDGYTPYGLYTAQGTNDTFVGKVNISGYGSVWLQNQNYTIITNSSVTNPVTNLNSNNGNYVLGSDLTNFGATYDLGYNSAYVGNFNGLGHTISGLTPLNNVTARAGFFGTIGSGSIVSNLGLVGAAIKPVYSNLFSNSGVLANTNQGTIVNSFSQGTISGFLLSSDYSGTIENVGGLVGDNSGLIINSHSETNLANTAVFTGQYNGGLVGTNEATGKIFDSYATGTVNSNTYAGGLAGRNAGLIDSSYSTGLLQIIDNGPTTIAGFVGLNTSSGRIVNSYTTASTTGADTANAIVAGFVYENDGTITNAYSAGTLGTASATWTIAGFVYNNATTVAGGVTYTGSISSVYSAETLLSSNIATYVSAFSNTNSGSITNAYWDTSRAGGAAEIASAAVGLDATQSLSLSNYAGFDTAYWVSSSDGHPILYTIPLYLVPTANNALQYGADGSAIVSNLAVVGLQWGDTASDVFSYVATGGLLSQSGVVNAGTYNYAQLVSGSVYSHISGAITIAPRILTLSADGIVLDKTYDSSLSGTIDVTALNNGLLNLFLNETLGAIYSNAIFIDKNVGDGKTVTVTVVLSNGTNGGLASNYTIVVKSTTADITPATLTAVYTAANKTYDGTTATTVTTTSLNGVIGSDQVSVSTTGQFANANAGNGKLVTASLSGNDAGNYILVSNSPVTADILPRVIDLSGAKLADGTSSATAGQLQVTNVVAGDSVSLSGSVSLASASAGVQTITSVAGLTQNNANYTLSGATGTVAVLSSFLPVLSSISSGTVTTAATTTSLTVNQSTQSAIINWTSFNIAPGYSVTFNQPSATSITLNRIIGNEQSVIAGSLSANGRLIFVNSAGILFTSGSTVNVGGIVASTQDIADSDFLAGHYNFGANAATGSIDVLGDITINQTGSYAAFIGNGVSTRGSVRAPGGTILLAGGENISLTLGTGLSAFTVTTADKAVSAGGLLDVSSTMSNGGLIATQGSTVATTDSLVAMAAGASGFTNGSWLIRQNGDLTIGSGGTISGANLNYILNQLSVTAQATATSSAAGNIIVNDPVSWSANTLSLNAVANIYVNTVMTASGTANLSGTYGTGFNADGSTMGLFTQVGTSDVLNSSYAGRIDFSSSGTVKLNDNTYTAIRSLAQLAAISGSSSYYFLAQDLTDYVPYSTAVIATFNGTLDGFGHVINNLTLADTTRTGGEALIGSLGSSTISTAVLRNLGLVNLNINTTGALVGGLAVYNYGTISNSFVTGSLTAQTNLGGLVSINNKTIENSFAVVTINAGFANINGITQFGGGVGGLVSIANANSFILNSHAVGTLDATYTDTAGGLVASNRGRIDNSWANVAVDLNGSAGFGVVGGLVGYNGPTGIIYNGSHSLGNVTGHDSQSIGGFVGQNDNGLIIGTVDGTVAGAVNWVYETGNVTLYISATSGLVCCFGGFGGTLIGNNQNITYVDYVYETGNVSVIALYPNSDVIINNVGGLFGNTGQAQSSSIGGASYVYGDVDVPSRGLNVSQTGGGTRCVAGQSGCPVDPCVVHSCTPVVTPPPTPPPIVTAPPVTPPDTVPVTTSSLPVTTDPGASTNPNTNPGTGTGFGTGTGTGVSSLGGQAGRVGGSAIAGTVGGGGSSSSSPDSNNPAGASQQSASLNPNSLDDQISNQVPATTTPPPPSKPKEKKERKALNTPKQKPDAGYGAEIRSIVIDGQKYDLQDEGPKNSGDGKSCDSKSCDAPNTDAPSPPAPAGDKPQ